ncbi:MAG: hypothetical protein A3C14_06015 [Candidatus Lloydbacteria bacterium RIFCSPHIGHO2_02_FULL_50_18]|nr:MAG: hypothetical protein A3C14_06015 [Candidatus Lloydbacteria bacterium RIFCSPHIGHO2_02_FULL_50_18]
MLFLDKIKEKHVGLSFPIFTYLHGNTTGKTTGQLRYCDESTHPLTCTVGLDEYCAYVHENMLAHCQLVIFDGFILPGGLPRGAQIFDYEYGRSTDKYRTYGVKKILHIEKTATVKGGSELSPSFCEYKERDINYVQGVTVVTLRRYIIAIPHGHRVLGFRVRPRSLDRQYTSIEATSNNVIFRSVVK